MHTLLMAMLITILLILIAQTRNMRRCILSQIEILDVYEQTIEAGDKALIEKSKIIDNQEKIIATLQERCILIQSQRDLLAKASDPYLQELIKEQRS